MFNGFLMHGYLPNEFMSSSLTPTIKDPKGDITSTANYRPIAVSSIISKLFEFVLVNRIVPHLNLSSNQFGYCEGVGLDTCVYIVKEHLLRLDKLGSNPLVCFIDASQAFDRVNYNILFRKLIDRNVPGYIIRTLQFWY